MNPLPALYSLLPSPLKDFILLVTFNPNQQFNPEHTDNGETARQVVHSLVANAASTGGQAEVGEGTAYT